MELKYTVHYNVIGENVKSVEVDGEVAQLIQKKRKVELVSIDGQGGSIQLVLPADAEFPAEADAVVTVKFTADKAKGEKVS